MSLRSWDQKSWQRTWKRQLGINSCNHDIGTTILLALIRIFGMVPPLGPTLPSQPGNGWAALSPRPIPPRGTRLTLVAWRASLSHTRTQHCGFMGHSQPTNTTIAQRCWASHGKVKQPNALLKAAMLIDPCLSKRRESEVMKLTIVGIPGPQV
jgi:hypothetical protein